MKIECGGLLFTSDFDSGNLDKVEYVDSFDDSETKIPGCITETSLPPLSNYRFARRPPTRTETPFSSPVHVKKYNLKRHSFGPQIKKTFSTESVSVLNQSVKEFKVWTRPDCYGTSFQTTFRTWFHFGVAGGPPGGLIKINVMNLNRQGKLYFHGMKPVFKVVPSKDGWKRIPGKVDFKCGTDGNFMISFCHTLPFDCSSVTYFAFTFPFTYTECQNMLDAVDAKVGSSLYISKTNKPPDSAIYYCRELLCNSTEGNKVELLTITSCKGLSMEREKSLPDLFPDSSKPRCHVFQNKKIIFVSSRVHPGETPSSFVFNGMLDYLLYSKDCSANRLRNLFVFKLIPMLNPDGVRRGHYRADVKGLNLNRIYMVANFQEHPSIYAARTLLLHYHTSYSTAVDPTVPVSKSNHKKIRNNQTHVSLNQPNKDSIPCANRKLPKDLINQMHKKTVLRKHSLHTCDTLTKNLNFFASVPVVVPFSYKGRSSVSNSPNPGSSANSPKKSKRISTTFISSEACESISKEKETVFKQETESSSACKECKASEYPSKKITLENDSSCNCVEASDADESSSFDYEMMLGEGDASKLLKDVPCLKPEESGIAYYFDLHGHASKRGCFIYGNYFPDIDKMVDCMFLPKLMSINCPYFDFSACNFSAENMYSGSNSNIQSKEGSGRVSLYVLTGIIHSYTLECNYNTCRFTTNQKKPKRLTNDVPSQVFFTPEIYQQVS
ncbi:cytosolic carboxypeptidase-like protein 5, partial [Uloborus diversus]|uniref:cytosolic carboxypeptidase-like protein 5 n=1 Tax=Uloborus diversus TaxID=327109 RepID=UPI002409DDBB